jgi:hypothetical protein
MLHPCLLLDSAEAFMRGARKVLGWDPRSASNCQTLILPLAAQLEGVSGGPAGAGIEPIAAALRMKSPENSGETEGFPIKKKGRPPLPL